MKFSFKILKFLRDFFLFDCFILSVMVLQCVVVKSSKLGFQLHLKKKVHNDSLFGLVWTMTLDVSKSTLD